MNAYIKNTERSQINDLMLHLKLPKKQEQAKLKTSRRETIKIRTKINEIGTKNIIQRIMQKAEFSFFLFWGLNSGPTP
jgi:hypothetical protein